MNQEELARCHLIISHPTKPKFLAIRLSDGSWSPPWVSVPQAGFVGSRASDISRTVREQYGLNTTVLRQLFESRLYHCLELEVHSQAAAQNYKAIWVGAEDYRKFRNFPYEDYDPFELWLDGASRPEPPRGRLPWERPGWFRAAADWFTHQLETRHIQVTGSVQQLRAAWQSSAILRVRTSVGDHFLKAAFAAPPNEAALTLALSERWPELVPKPVSVDTRRDWLISPDYRGAVPAMMAAGDYARAARSLAQLQIESAEELDRWRQAGCIDRGPGILFDFLGSFDRLHPLLRSGRSPFDSGEMSSLNIKIKKLGDKCQQLSEHGIPDTLVYADFSPSNVYRREQGYWLTDWADSIISNPLFSLAWFIQAFLLDRQRRPDSGDSPDAVIEGVTDAYLAPFETFAPRPDGLREALNLAAELSKACRLQQWFELLPLLEPNSRASRRVEAAIRKTCRLWAAEEAGG
ncbi:MAG: hypothetical protein KJN94_07805 [Gammaproteobacteria bacterium]|nr:hypothetical protein [Gammaproteobacteria bacterium]